MSPRRQKLRRIRESADALFREKGYEAATTREIAERADVATGTLFLYAAEEDPALARHFVKEQLFGDGEHQRATIGLRLRFAERLADMIEDGLPPPKLTLSSSQLSLLTEGSPCHCNHPLDNRGGRSTAVQ